MLSALRFYWIATRGHHLRPWKSEFLRWRIETYSGMKAESLTAGDVFRFLWNERWELIRFLSWTEDMKKEATKKVV
ncbi:MAG: hypothetical protein KGN79_11810 [Acidobacteriota bacterium]|nr:hypothetical protein [Acidobacteriota bacterium]